MTDDGEQKEVTEKKVKNKIKINPKLGEAIEEIGGEVLEAYTVTNADKKGNTPAYQGYKAGKKNVKTGKPMYKAADHLKDDVEISPEVEKLIESGLFSDSEIAKIADIQEADIADILARLEKKRISKGGNPDDSPLPAMKKYHADKKKKAKK